MQDILYRLANTSSNESSHELQCRCFDAAEEISKLRAALEDIASGEMGINICIKVAKQVLPPNG